MGSGGPAGGRRAPGRARAGHAGSGSLRRGAPVAAAAVNYDSQGAPRAKTRAARRAPPPAPRGGHATPASPGGPPAPRGGVQGGAARDPRSAGRPQVSVLVPECGLLPQELRALLARAGPYFSVRALPLWELLAPRFVSTFVQGGSCYALSFNTSIDEDNAAALLPSGKLILSLDKDTYEETGLQGRPSRHAGKNTVKFIVVVDLLDLSLNPASKKSQRVLWSFREKQPLTFDFLLAWDPAGAEDSAMMSYFSSYQIREHQPCMVLSTVAELECPVLQSGEPRGQPGDSCSAPDFLEWLGAVFSGAELKNEPDSFISTYCCPQPSTVAARASLCTLSGLLLPAQISALLEQLRRYFAEPKLAPWVALSVQGFADSPVSWGEDEHGFGGSGDHLYSFVIFGNQDYWLQMAVGARDECPP
ncbi:ribonuclease P protein subunit p40 isoform X2 [Sorex araneus]|uniref:ribonuclease P protein subunit p40 isoform X2 n=1 Tax=Sorex araneus TaxID=42254 RepID=UPI00243363BF|nr:ribonuclease P protein subunit p40 isoform X2 [Sorex araneus]